MAIQFAERMEGIKGSAIRELLKIAEQPDIISFGGGFPAAESFPLEKMKAISLKVLNEDGVACLQYGGTDGVLALRQGVSKLMELGHIKIDPANILITHGSQQGLEFSAKLFVNKGDTIITESPSYLGALNAFKAYQPNFVEIDMDEDGMKMDELEIALKNGKNVKFIYAIPDFQNPTGRTMSVERRKRLVELANEYNVPVIEDNPYGALRFEGEILPAIKSFDTKDMVIYLGTLSKVFCPGLRIGWIAASPEIVNKYNLIKQGADLQNNSMAQREAALFLSDYDINAHIKTIVDMYRIRRDVMLKTMEEEFPTNVTFTHPQGGLFTWVNLPEGIDAQKVFEKALEVKVAFVPGEPFYPNSGNANHFRLNYSAMPEAKIIEGIKRLGKVLKEMC